MALDPTTPIGKIRLRCGDFSDLPILPDSVIQSALDDCQGNLYRAAALYAQYILGTLTAKTHKKLAQIETWSNEQFDNYVQFLKLTTLNPNLSTVAPIPYIGERDGKHPLEQFMEDWRTGFLEGSCVVPPQATGAVIEYGLS